MLALLLAAHVLGAAATASSPTGSASWPASAGPPPSTWSVVYRDPRARYFDPPAGRYSKGDGSLIDADPPAGYYDPPPGYYPRDRAQALAYGNSLGPLPEPMSAQEVWERKRLRLRIGLGVAGSALGIAVLAPILSSIAYHSTTRDPTYTCIDCWDPGILILMGLGPPALIATTVYAIRLGIHARRRPASARVDLGSGGLRWRF